jgi:ferredoxin
VRSLKDGLDRGAFLNRGVVLGMRLHGVLGALLAASFRPMVALTRMIYATPALAWLARGARAVLRSAPGPAHRRGAPAQVEATLRSSVEGLERGASHASTGEAARQSGTLSDRGLEPAATNGTVSPAAATAQAPDERALHCVNCGECNSVCPIFQESKIRLPQMLTHLGETVHAGAALPATGSLLLDFCMRCGNCEEVCQAGIPHLPLYEKMQRASDQVRPRDLERHTAIVSSVRASAWYTRDFLQVRPGGYLKRSPASLPGVVRYLVLRAENDSGPASTCIHCGACVAVCPTHANREFEGADPRSITTEQNRCIGCGTCVEICPANLANGGQTLRVMEAPTRDWFLALETLEQGGRT